MIAIYLIVFLASVLYLWMKYVFGYWQRLSFPYLEPSIPFGNLGDIALGRKSMGQGLWDLHGQSQQPVVGIYSLLRPVLLFRDAKVVKTILTSDFQSFHDRGVYYNPSDPVAGHMLMAPGQEWRNIRNKLTPTFTSGKLKGMLPTIIQIGEKLRRKFTLAANNNELVEVKELCIRYSLDIVGTVGFGLDVNTIEDPNDSFRDIEKLVNNGDLVNRFRLVGAFFCPKILELARMSPLTDEFKEYMINIVRDTIEYREKRGVSRKDFIQLLIELRSTGKVSSDDVWNADTKPDSTPPAAAAATSTTKAPTTTTSNEFKSSLTIEQCAAQVALFYLAGFDTTASAISYCLFELSRQSDLLKRLQREIDDTMTKHNNVITYDCIQEMPFLDLCVREIVRMYPTLSFLNRECTQEYKIPDTNLTVPKGTPVLISLLGVMRDPDNFPNPSKFWPDRYSDEDPHYNPDAYIPFGEGPRACIGMRMGKIVAKIGLIMLLQKFNFECMDNRDLEHDTHSVTLVVKGGINLRISNRN